MPYVSRELLKRSLAALKRAYGPLAIVSLPCMLKQGVPTCATPAEAQAKGIAFGAADERKWLDKYFRISGAPPDKPYFMPATGEWVQERYPDRALQRRRKDFEDSIFFHPDSERWALRPGAATIAAQRLIPAGNPPIPLAALMAWMWRTRELTALPEALEEFIGEMHLDRDDFVGRLYDKSLPKDLLDAGLAATPLTADDLSDLTGAVPPPPASPSLKEMVDKLAACRTEQFSSTEENCSSVWIHLDTRISVIEWWSWPLRLPAMRTSA